MIIPNRYKTTLFIYRETELMRQFRSAIDLTKVQSKLYTIKEGDTFDTIATRAYGAPEYWFILSDANPHIEYPFDILNMVGEEIKVPSRIVIDSLGL